MAKTKEVTFVVAQPPSEDIRIRWCNFIVETLAKYENATPTGTLRKTDQKEEAS